MNLTQKNNHTKEKKSTLSRLLFKLTNLFEFIFKFFKNLKSINTWNRLKKSNTFYLIYIFNFKN